MDKKLNIVEVRLIRFHDCGENGIIGVLSMTDRDGKTRGLAHTLERPWLGNKPYESCIPGGDYTCVRRVSPKFGETFEVRDVRGRTDILFHPGNAVDDTQGCILVGAWEPGASIVTHSKAQMARFLKALNGVSEFRFLVGSTCATF